MLRPTGLTLLWLLLAALPWVPAAHGYDYPFNDPYLATVVGTPPRYQAVIPEIRLHKGHLKPAPDRRIPDALWYGRRLEYSYAAQPGPAPLIFSIAGTGGYHDSGTNAALLKAFYAAGYHVVGITSPTHPEFIISASALSVPGNLREDAGDLYRVMTEIRDHLASRLDIRGYHLTGYSLGAIHSAFVAELDEQRGTFGFERVVLINSPVSLYASISKLDRMLDNIPGGIDNFNHYFNGIVQRISEVYTRSTTVEFNQDLVFEAFKQNPPSNEELAAIIGVAFRLAAANMIFTADVMTDYGFIKPREVRLRRNSTMADYLQVALRVGLTDYFHEFFWPFYEARLPAGVSRADFAYDQSLESIVGFLRRAQQVEVVHNLDDIILADHEIDFFRRVFGDRAKIYPNGGHLGNILQRETLGHIISSLRNGGAP